MGYRSDWYLAINGDTAKKVKEDIDKTKVPELVWEALSFGDYEYVDGVMYFNSTERKMYKSSPSVDAFYSWLDTFDNEDFRYIEVGNDDNAISTIGGNYDLIYEIVVVERYGTNA